MLTCPNCGVRLLQAKTADGLFFVCPECRGRAGALIVLRRAIGQMPVRQLWRAACESAASPGKNCPVCLRPMRQVSLPIDADRLALDVCTPCGFVWFDAHELERFPHPPPTPPPKQLPERAVVELAKAQERLDKLRRIASGESLPHASPGPEEVWKWIPAMFSLPVEIDPPPVDRIPWVTYSLTLALVAVYLLTMGNLDAAIGRLAFLPASPLRAGGITALTSFFLHAGIAHLACNCYFLAIFGVHVEDYLGLRRYAWLLLIATLTGQVTHLLFDPHVHSPCIGASGGISGVVVFYALTFPHARVGLLLHWWGWLHLRAATAMVFWLLLQLWGAYAQLHQQSPVSSLAHLGGILAGMAAWFAWRER